VEVGFLPPFGLGPECLPFFSFFFLGTLSENGGLSLGSFGQTRTSLGGVPPPSLLFAEMNEWVCTFFGL